MRTSPAALTAQQIDILLSLIQRVRDAHEEDVHDARVATRRLAELLPLAAVELGESLGRLDALIRLMRRALGAVRDLDSQMALCDEITRVIPTSAGALAALRTQLGGERERAARRLVKRIDRLDLDTLRAQRTPSRPLFSGGARRWNRALVERVGARATKLARAIHRSSGVYFPNRLHRVRVHLKKLRYLVEIAEVSGAWRPRRLRRDAGRLQDTLGAIHDRQVLLDRLESVEADPMVASTLHADIRNRYREYLDRRDRLAAIVYACQRFSRGKPHRTPQVVSLLTVALLPATGLLIIGRQADDHEQRPVLTA